jgi:tRNA(His) 5'-end guanylyltransferase
MEEYKDIVLAFGESDEFRCVFLRQARPCHPINSSRSFLFRKSTSLYNRRQAKIVSTLTSLFTSSYVFHWQLYFPDTPLRYPPSFDGRIVLYPSAREVRDYFAWRQADSKHHYPHYATPLLAEMLQCDSAHQQPLQYSILGSCTARWRDYNTGTCNFAGPLSWSVSASQSILANILQQLPSHSGSLKLTYRVQGSNSGKKHEILFSRFNINYNEIQARYRKGSVLVRMQVCIFFVHKEGYSRTTLPEIARYGRVVDRRSRSTSLAGCPSAVYTGKSYRRRDKRSEGNEDDWLAHGRGVTL